MRPDSPSLPSSIALDASQLREHLATAARRFPAAWRIADDLRAARGKALIGWPSWCFLPLAYAPRLAADRSARMHGAERPAGTALGRLWQQLTQLDEDLLRLGALVAWRATQGIYRFDPTLFAALRETPVRGDLPCEVLHRLPEWCVYVPTPPLAPMHGFWAHLNYDIESKNSELRFVLHHGRDEMQPLSLKLGRWSLDEALDRGANGPLDDVNQKLQAASNEILASPFLRPLATSTLAPAGADAVQASGRVIEPLVSLLLYLCSANAELGDDTSRPRRPEPTHTKRGPRLFAPEASRTWDVGVRLGPALQRALEAHAVAPSAGGSHASPRPHIRRARWQGFWTGPKNDEQVLLVKWLPPVPVNVDSFDDLPTTIRRVPGVRQSDSE